jgi:RNA polymerase sigma factor (sigma-70 family)
MYICNNPILFYGIKITYKISNANGYLLKKYHLHMKTLDKKLLEAIAYKDENAFNEFYKRYAALLYKWAFTRIGNAELSNDVTQDFWFNLWTNPQTMKTNNEGSAKNFLLHFFTFRILDYLRAHQKREKSLAYNEHDNLSSTLSYSHILEEIHEKEIYNIINEILDNLPELTRKIFVCRWNDNYTIKETALYLNIDEKSVYNRTFIALKTIRSKIKSVYFYENSINDREVIVKKIVLLNILN